METIYKKDNASARLLRHIVPSMMPKYGKRAVFLTTLFMEIAKLSPSHKQLVEELNHRLHLVENDAALNFPMSLKETVWGGHQLNIRNRKPDEVEISDLELEGMARRIISHGGKWSRYDDYQKVLEDTKEVIRTSILCQQTVH